eukprot:g6473.t1
MNDPGEPGGADTAADLEPVPSVKEILEEVAAEAGLLPGSLDDAFAPDEDEAARDVAKAMSAARPLLEHYRHRHEELTSLLSKAQASASSATAEARELCQGHLQTFGRIEEGCTMLAQELQRAAAASSASGAADPHNPAQQGGGGGGGKEAAARRRRVAAAAEADALVARHRSLVQRRRRMRSALRVLEVSERGRAALEAGTGERVGKAGGRWARAEEAMKAIESLRALLGECRSAAVGDALERNATRSPPATAAAPRMAVAATATADGELARVAHGRLEWLTRRLRVHLSSELAGVLRQLDPLAAAAGGGDTQEGGQERGAGGGGVDQERRREELARVKEAMKRLVALQFGASAGDGAGTGGGAGGGSGADTAKRAAAGTSGGAIWALDGLLEPVAVRFRFHFEEDRPTNRMDRPEWFLSFLLRALEAYRPLLLLCSGDVQPAQTASSPSPADDEGGDEGETRTGAGESDSGWGAGGVDPVAYFARGLTLLARRRLRAQLGAAASDGSLLSHTVEEALAFDRRLDEEAGYAECPARFPRQTWPRCVEVFAQDEERFELWITSDASAAEAKLKEAAAAPGAWRAVEWENGPASSTPVTPSAVALCRIFWGITERYRPLRDPLKQLRFARHVQEPVLRSYRDMLYRRGTECRLNSVFRDDGGGGEDKAGAGAGAGGTASAADGLTATWAAALGAAMLGPAQEADDDKSPIGRWRGYCLAVASCAYVCAVLRESEDDMLFAEMSEAAAAAAAATVLGVGGEAGRPSSLGAMGSVVGVAVGGVSQAVTSVATTAETATAGVVRAVGAQGSIIGPTHAISAALTSLKGAARRVRKASSSSSSPSLGHRGTGSNGIGGVEGAMTTREDDTDEEGEEEQEQEQEQGGGHADGGGGNGGGATTAAEIAGGGYGGAGGAAAAAEVEAEAAMRDGGAAIGEWTGSVFGQEARRYGKILEAMVRGAVESCRDGFLWRTRSYLRAWDRGIAVVVPASASAARSSLSGPRPAAEASGRLGAGVELLETAVGVARECLPPAQFHKFWTALASELDATLVKQIVGRRSEMSQDEGLQLWADLQVLMGPFDALARRRPEKNFPALAEASVLLSLEKSQLRSLSSGLDAHGGGVEQAVRGGGWDGWREEGGALSPEGTQLGVESL